MEIREDIRLNVLDNNIRDVIFTIIVITALEIQVSFWVLNHEFSILLWQENLTPSLIKKNTIKTISKHSPKQGLTP